MRRHALAPGFLTAAVLVALVPVRAGAVNAKTWIVRSQSGFLEGQAEGLLLEASGEVRLAPRLVKQADLEEPVVWGLEGAGDGAAWVATGSSGRLLRVSSSGEIEEAGRFEELQVTALLGDGDGVLAATSPNGAIYRVLVGAEPELYARPEAEYIWALVRGEDGRVYVGTGVEGKVFVLRDGTAELFYKAPDQHVVSLAVSGGRLIAGTDERGLILAIAADGQASVLYDSSYREARGLAVDSSGIVYAAINGGASYEQASAKAPPSDITVTVTGSDSGDGGDRPPAPPPALTLVRPESLGELGSEVVRLLPGGDFEVEARLRGEIVHDLDLAPAGDLLIGTSKRLIVPAGGDRTSVIALKSSDGDGQVSAVVRHQKNLFVATTSPSVLFALGRGVEGEGSYTTKVFNAQGGARWGRLAWEADVPAGTTLQLQARSGNTSEPDETWTEWSALLDKPGIPEIPLGRFAQLRARFSSSHPDRSPLLRSMTLGYLPQNLRPVVKTFVAEAPGAVYQKSAGGQNLVDSTPPPIAGMFEELNTPAVDLGGSKRLYRRGAQTVTWEVSDPNEDAIVVRLYVRRQDGSGPRLLVRDRAEGQSFSFDSVVLPDGFYVAELEVDDGEANSEGMALIARDTSLPFLVDNTPPRVAATDSRIEKGRGVARFTAEDDGSALWKAQWSLDGGSFLPLLPEDGITDAPRESFEILTEKLEPGEHLIVVQVVDMANQSAAAHVVVSVK